MLDGARVLIVEDDPQLAELFAQSVEDCEGRVVGPFSGFRETKRYIETENAPDGAILDFRLADGEVTPISTFLRERGIPVVICTGVYVPLRMREAAPNFAYIPKPVSPHEVVARLGAMLRDDRAF